MFANRDDGEIEKRARQRSLLHRALDDDFMALLADPSIREIDINDNGTVFIEKLGIGGGTIQADIAVSASRARNIAEVMAAEIITTTTGARFDKDHPSLHGKLNYTDLEFVRVALTCTPSVDQHTAEIRKHSSIAIPLEVQRDQGNLDAAQYEAVCQFVDERKNVVIFGRMFAGKTALANSVLQRINVVDPVRRYGYFEDVKEMVCPLRNRKGVLATEARRIPEWMADTVRWNLESVSISEVRDGEAAYRLFSDLWLQAPGGLTTSHGHDWRRGIRRLEAIMRAVGKTLDRDILAQAIGGIIVMGFAHKIGRKVTGVYSVDDELTKDGELALTLHGTEYEATADGWKPRPD